MTIDKKDTIPVTTDVTIGRVAKNTFLNYINSVVSLLSGIFISIIVARSLGPDKLGAYSGISYLVGLIVTIFSLGLGSTIIKILSEYSARFGYPVVRRVLRMIVFGVAIPASIAALTTWGATQALNHDQRYTTLMIIVAAFSVYPLFFSQIYRSIVTGLQDFGFLLRINLISTFILLIGTIVVRFVQPSIVGYLLIGVVANLFTSLIIAIKYRHILSTQKTDQELPPGISREIFSYLWPIAIISILDMIVWQYSEILFLGAFRPSREVAFYTMAFTLATLLLRGIASSVTAAFLPAMSQLFGQGDKLRIGAAYQSGTRFTMIVAFSLAAIVAGLAREIIMLFYGVDFSPAATYVPFLVISAAFATVAGIGADVLNASRKQLSMLKLSAVIAGVNLILDAFLIAPYGIAGAVAANVIAQLAGVIGVARLVEKQLDQKIPIHSYFRPLIAAVCSTGIIFPLSYVFHGWSGLVVHGLIGMLVIFVFLRLFRAMSHKETEIISDVISHAPPILQRPGRRLIQFLAPGINQ